MAESLLSESLIERGHYQIETFLLRYGDCYRELLDYAAIPMVITPELLNYLRVQFAPKLPWVAEVDLLLSDLCRLVGYGQYVLQSYVREVLLDTLDTRLGKSKLESAAKLLIGYVEQQKRHNQYLSDREIKRQRWSAMAFIDDLKPKVAQELIDEFGQSFLEGKAQGDLLELVAITEQLSAQLGEFPKVIDHARAVGQLLRDRTPDLVEQLTTLNRQLQQTSNFPSLQDFEFEVAIIEVEERFDEQIQGTQEPITTPVKLEQFRYQVAKIRVVEFGIRGKPKQTKTEIIKTSRLGQYFIEYIEEHLKLEMVYIPSGEFMMGSDENEIGSYGDERPQHLVTVPAFLMGRYPITQVHYKAIMGTNPSIFKDKPDSDRRPVENVSVKDANEFCKRLSDRTRREYQLPSEAQWEYACRAMPSLPFLNGSGLIYPPFYFGETISTKIANYDGSIYDRGEKGESRGKTTPVEYFGVANEFGLCDMHGNVWELCSDTWHSNYEGAPTDGSAWIDGLNNTSHYVLRGGSWFLNPQDCRSSYRNGHARDNHDCDIGFRVISHAPGLT